MSVVENSSVSKRLIQSIANETTLQSVLGEDSLVPSVVENLIGKETFQDFLTSPVGSIKDTQIKKLMATAISIAQKNDCLPFLLPSTDPIEIAKLVDEGLTRVKVAYQSGIGILDPIEVVDTLIDKSAARVVALVDHAFESGMVNQMLTQGVVSIMTVLQIPNAQAYAPIISNVISRVEKPAQNFIKNGISKIAQSAKNIVHKAVSSIKTYLVNQLKSFA